uniref:Uncharacterized protein n=1 Tax=Rhizophora mucronata TaxID=61149 RepID=A0A2P2L9W5_RHIMU
MPFSASPQVNVAKLQHYLFCFFFYLA